MAEQPISSSFSTWPRWAARASLLAAFLCFAMNCVFMQLTGEQPPAETQLANQVVGWSSMGVVIGGIFAGAAAIAGGWKARSRETLVMGGMGVVLNGGIVLVTLWMLAAIRAARP